MISGCPFYFVEFLSFGLLHLQRAETCIQEKGIDLALSLHIFQYKSTQLVSFHVTARIKLNTESNIEQRVPSKPIYSNCLSTSGLTKKVKHINEGTIQTSLDPDKPGELVTSLESLFQCLTTLLVKKLFFLPSLNLP